MAWSTRTTAFALAHPGDGADAPATTEAQIAEVAWRPPRSIPLSNISPLLHPLIAAWPGLAAPGFVPLAYRGEHYQDAGGLWRPRLADGTPRP